jgi:hypothetical protein
MADETSGRGVACPFWSETAMELLVYLVVGYLLTCLSLCVYMLGKLWLGRRMSVLVGPVALGVTRPPFRPLVPRERGRVDRERVIRAMRQAA